MSKQLASKINSSGAEQPALPLRDRRSFWRTLRDSYALVAKWKRRLDGNFDIWTDEDWLWWMGETRWDECCRGGPAWVHLRSLKLLVAELSRIERRRFFRERTIIVHGGVSRDRYQ